MTERTMPAIPKGLDLTPEQIEAISGGDGSCLALNMADISAQLKSTYDNLVDFTSYVMERVITSTQ